MVKKAVVSILVLFVVISVGFLTFKAGGSKTIIMTAGGSGGASNGAVATTQPRTPDNGGAQTSALEDVGVSHEIIDLTPVDGPSRQIVAVYFYNDTRCKSCRTIEKWTHESLMEGFDNELKAKVLSWRMVNTDVPENAHYLKDYAIYTKSVVLVEYVDKKQVNFVNLDKIWDLLRNDADFKNYVTVETRSFLDGKKADATAEAGGNEVSEAADGTGAGKGA